MLHFSLIRHLTQTSCRVTKECDWIVSWSTTLVSILQQTLIPASGPLRELDWLYERILLNFWCWFLVIGFPKGPLMQLSIGFCCKRWHLIMRQVAGLSSGQWWVEVHIIPRAIKAVYLSAEVVVQSTCDCSALLIEYLRSNHIIFHIALQINPSTVYIDITRSLISRKHETEGRF